MRQDFAIGGANGRNISVLMSQPAIGGANGRNISVLMSQPAVSHNWLPGKKFTRRKNSPDKEYFLRIFARKIKIF
ncbi:hypothetical protein AC249_AIPGENE12248 [Exaiptasia diaphana]|nr:hypothetical protein AC249_AIPGENE12248 [Exaiptasia diaphana]